MSPLSFVYTPVLAHVLQIDVLKRQVRILRYLEL